MNVRRAANKLKAFHILSPTFAAQQTSNSGSSDGAGGEEEMVLYVRPLLAQMDCCVLAHSPDPCADQFPMG